MSKETVYNKLTELGYSKDAIAGIMANIEVETGGTFDPKQKQELSNGGVGKGRGLFQIEVGNPLYSGYKDFLEQTGKKNTAESQIEFMHETIYGDYQDIIGAGHARELRKTFESGDAKQATLEFMKRWERPGKPHTERRLKAATNYLDFTPTDAIEQAIQDTQPQGITVERGDTLYSISMANNISVKDLMKLNNITDPTKLMVGQQLKVK
jgi:hypothetical protein